MRKNYSYMLLAASLVPLSVYSQSFNILCTSEYEDVSEYLPDDVTYRASLKKTFTDDWQRYFKYVDISEDKYLNFVIECPVGSSPTPAIKDDYFSYIFRVHKVDKSYWAPGSATFFDVVNELTYRVINTPELLFLRFSYIYLKEEITPFNTSVDEMLQLEAYQYRYVNQEQTEIGLLAQQVEEVYPNLVLTDKETGNKLVDYKGMVPILLESIRELNERVEQLESKLEQQ